MNEDYYVDEYKGGWAVWHHKSAFPWQLPVVTSGESREKALERYARYIGFPAFRLEDKIKLVIHRNKDALVYLSRKSDEDRRTDFTSEDWT